ncbi:MAG TPA: NPCBM/NEW2 domain-containing protein [Planctomycetota bacterium]|nr:NPCBM/NEW2 domain-containing protein [Planctomycetota bacterium]
MRFVAFVMCCLAAFARIGTAEESVEVTVITLEGEEKAEKLAGIRTDAFVLESGRAAFKDVSEVRFGGADTAPPPATIFLRNGDQLKATILSGDDTKLKLKNGALGELDLENHFIDGITFTIKEGPAPDAIDAFMKGAAPKEDLLLLPKGDTVSGFVERFSDKDLTFNVGGQSRPFAFDAIAAFRLAPLKEYKRPDAFAATLLLRDGSQLTGKLGGLKDNAISFESISGQEWRAETGAIKSILFQGGKLVYLSDLKPKEVEEKPYVGGMPVVYGWRKDQAATGEKLTIAGKTYARGIGVHSFARLSFDVGGQYAKLLCDVGLDASAPPNAVASWKIIADGKELAAGTAKAGEAAQTVRKEVAGVKTLEFICDYGSDDDDAGDHLDWANARLIKP